MIKVTNKKQANKNISIKFEVHFEFYVRSNF